MLPKLAKFNKKHNLKIECNSRYFFVNPIQLGFCYYLSAESRSSELHTNSYIFKMSSICKYFAWVASVHYNLMDARANVVTTHINSRSIYSPVRNTPEKFENGGFAQKTHPMFSVHTTPKKFENSTFTGHFGFVFA